MDRKDIKSREIMISRNGKPLFAVIIDTKLGEGSDANYVFVENGDVKFASSWMGSIVSFELSNESHRLAKEIFTIGLQASIKIKVYELKQLESIIKDVHLEDCLGSVLIDNTKLLLEVNENFERKTKEIIDMTEKQMDNAVTAVKKSSMTQEMVKEAATEAIVETIKPIAVRKNKEKYVHFKEDAN